MCLAMAIIVHVQTQINMHLGQDLTNDLLLYGLTSTQSVGIKCTPVWIPSGCNLIQMHSGSATVKVVHLFNQP